jgi:hypothetical protein
VRNGDTIIAVWNDDQEMEQVEVHQAVIYIQRGADLGELDVPSGLLLVVYGPHDGQLQCFEVRRPVRGHQQV